LIEGVKMSLAQVVYNISTDSDFAAAWHEDPKAALARKGYQLSQEEINFLAEGLKKSGHEGGRRVNLSEIVLAASSWKG
jgi:hypothetical protein